MLRFVSRLFPVALASAVLVAAALVAPKAHAVSLFSNFGSPVGASSTK